MVRVPRTNDVKRIWRRVDSVATEKAPTFRSPLHNERTAAVLGFALGVTFITLFLTGLLSHMIQQPPSWFLWTSRPAGLYRVTQGLHVVAGIASVPLLLAKLWTVYPHFVGWPPAKNVTHAVERLSLLPLVGGSLFQLFTGVTNIARFYPYPFFFTSTHYLVGWVTIGALIVHIGAKAATTKHVLLTSAGAGPTTTSVGLTTADLAPAESTTEDSIDRRAFLATVFATSGLLTAVTIGQTINPLRGFGVLAPRRPDIGPQGLPVNKSASGAKVLEAIRADNYRLTIGGKVEKELTLSMADLKTMPQHSARLPISCVEGWSAEAQWSGVRVRDLLELAGAAPDAEVRVESVQEGGAYNTSVLNRWHAFDRDTLLATHVNDEVLHVDHGYPIRLIGPNRPGVMQTKWVGKLVVV